MQGKIFHCTLPKWEKIIRYVVQCAVIPRYSVPQNSDFPRYGNFMLLTNFLSIELNIPQNSDFLPADVRSHYIEERLYI